MKKSKLIRKQYNSRVVTTFGILMFLMLALIMRVAWIQIVKGEDYKEMAIRQQTNDIPLEPKRGSIYDRNNKEMATSAIVYSVWIRPADFRKEYKNNLDDKIKQLADVIKMDFKDAKSIVESKVSLRKMAKYLEKEDIDKVRALKLTGIETTQDTKRYYPFGNFASQLLGSVTDENEGRSGIEYQYDGYLSGISGRRINQKDINGNALAYGNELYYGAENGLNVVLTIDSVLQHYAEETIETAIKDFKVSSAKILVMDPNNGDILAMASSGGFDPNNPMEPVDEKEKEDFAKLSTEDKTKFLNEMWKNPNISSVYEPGSTFKVFTTAMALENRIVTPTSTVYCSPGERIADAVLRCWSKVGHGYESMTEALANSCNPVQIKLLQKMGKEEFYRYVDMLGLTKTTGIDLPGETGSLVKSEKNIGPVDLATMSYGQGIAVTPIQLITAESAVANGGTLVKPRIVKALTDENGKVVKKFETKKIRKIFSTETTDEMKKMMEYIVAEKGATQAQVPGYRLGAKTGTANVPKDKKYGNDLENSIVLFAPADKPKYVLLVVATSSNHTPCAPISKIFNEKALPYLGVVPNN